MTAARRVQRDDALRAVAALRACEAFVSSWVDQRAIADQLDRLTLALGGPVPT